MAGKMTPLALMLMRQGENDNNRRREGGDGGRMAYGRDEPWEPDHRRMTYTPPYAEPHMRRDYQTRDGYEGRTEGRRMNYPRSAYDGEGMNDRRMGFGEQPMDNYDTEMRRRRRADGTFMHYGGEHEHEPIRFGGMVSMEGGGKRSGHHKLTREMAEEWVEGMESADPQKPHGGKWTMDQVKPVAQKYGVPTEGDRFVEFWAVMNALYSDYYAVAKKYNMLNPDFFADMAMAWINDKDAVRNKAAVYYECIVER